jgi:hypothetical protein
MIKGNPISTLWNSTFVFDASGENTIITHSRYAMVIVHTCINIANDHGYFPFVVITIQSFPHSWLIMGFVTRVIRRVPLVEQELLTVLGHLSSPSVLSGFLCMFTIVILYLSVEIQLSKRKGVEILLTGFIQPHCCTCPKLRPWFLRHMSFLCFEWFEVGFGY